MRYVTEVNRECRLAALMTGLTVITWIRFFVWLGLGLLIYIGYSRQRSEFANPK